ncbi:OmpA family protein [uncultured Gelidibacter sp.]|uniref:OmpA family protein n=1 Tax=uncultured Gelidibacter sp. TaxID=259318 RepID=UPI002622CBBA|nr:OmpA family protein [uncultured Gelidibacter sp.]
MKTKLFIFLFALSSTFMVAQKKLADKFFENYAYVKATELYEEAVKKGDSSEHVLTRLGDCYYNNSKSQEAALWYGKAVNKYNKVNPEYIFKYIQSLRSIGNYVEADKWMVKFKEIQSGDTRVKDFDANNLDMYEELASTDDAVVQIENLPFNSEFSDFGGYIANGTLYFASARHKDLKKNYGWNDEPFLDLYTLAVTEKEGKKEYGDPEFISSEKINSPYHEASVAITKDGKTMYFTRDNLNKRNKLGYDRKGTSHLKLYKATLEDGQWGSIVELPFNDTYFSNGHPALSPDNSKLYFVSDREGGFGQTDIYVVDILDNGKYGTPQNLGPKVNTAGREMFPFIAKDSTFYFSSDGYLNLGLLDIYKSNILKDENAEPENLGAPYNSGYDDFAFFMNDSTKTGYFSSNRPGGKGGDDIYSFNAEPCKQKIEGIARDIKTNEVLANVEVKLINKAGKIIATVMTTETGAFAFDADCDKTYTVLGSKKDYKDDLKQVATNFENGKVNNADLFLTPLIDNNQIVINPIFFDFDKWNIRTDAEYELENIVDVMRAHPEMVIKIESHTDSRGSDSYNMKLSDRRAKSTRDYIISRGIAAERIESAIGYGETQLLNKCSNGVKCSSEEHQMNRRSYFYILKD